MPVAHDNLRWERKLTVKPFSLPVILVVVQVSSVRSDAIDYIGTFLNFDLTLYARYTSHILFVFLIK